MDRQTFDRKLLNEIVGLVVDVLTSNAKTIRVNQEERPLGIVQGMYKKLDKFTVEYVIDSIKQCTRKAKISGQCCLPLYTMPH